MIIGVPKEIKTHEYRVGLTPDGTAALHQAGHVVLIEPEAGAGSGFPDNEYINAGAEVVSRDSVFNRAELIIKVKEPLASEFGLLKDNAAIFTYLHLAPNRDLTQLLLSKKITGLGYETLEKDGKLPLLKPMSAIAGRMAPLMGAFYLQKIEGGSGILPTGIEGVFPAKALILGAGVVGTNAALVCSGLGMTAIVADCNEEHLAGISRLSLPRVNTLKLDSCGLLAELPDTDILICAVLMTGMSTPKLITRSMLSGMRKGSVLVDVSVDQGGCAETSRPTTHDNPVYVEEGIVHYMVANMPGAYPRTSTLALTNATLPYIKFIADKGIESAISDPVVRSSLNTYRGEIAHPGLAKSAR